ncbi:hypothetical protein GB937_005426 [Aspergillus fischeri]|nr:hypothetical protein GB937_005426 [Aspergillus fischeri]
MSCLMYEGPNHAIPIRQGIRSDHTKQKPSITRPPLTKAEQELLCTHMMGMNEFDKLILHEPADTSVGDSDTQVFLNRLAAVSNATEMITLTADEAGTEPEQPKEAEVSDATEKIKGVIKNNVVEWSQESNVLPVLLVPAAPRVGVLVSKRIRSGSWQCRGLSFNLPKICANCESTEYGAPSATEFHFDNIEQVRRLYHGIASYKKTRKLDVARSLAMSIKP